jgi:putative PEP-CTERM system TPR-repeat lipoprotein
MSKLPLPAALSAALLLSCLAACSRTADTASLIAGARSYQQKGDSRAAVIQLKNALEREPNNAAARALLGDYYLEGGDVLSADKEFRRARQAGMAPAEILPRVARVMLMQQQYQQVLDELPKDSALPAFLTLRAYALLGLNQRPDATALLDRVLSARPGDSMALLGKARLALLDGAPGQALDYAQAALDHHPGDVDSLRFKGDLLRAQGKLGQARACYEQILKNQPGNLQARVDIATMLLQSDNFPDAKAQLTAARRIAPGSPLVDYTQALLEFRLKNYSAAQELLQRLLRLLPDYLPALLMAGAVQYELGHTMQAEQHLQRFLDHTPGHLYASKLMAAIALKKGKPDEAAALLAPLLGRHPDDVELLATAGDAHMRLHHFSQAADYFQKAAKLAPSAPGLRAALGTSRLAMGDGQRAIAELEQAKQLNGGAQRAGMLLIATQIQAKEYGKALAAVRQLEKQVNSPAVQNIKGGVLLATQDLAGARQAFEAALALEAAYLPALANLAQLDTLDRHPERARQRYQAALASDKDNVDLMTALAKLAAGQGNVPEATAWLEQARRTQPDALAPALLLGNFYLRAGDKQKALALAGKLQASNAGNADALTLLAEAQAANGNQEAALESYRSLAVIQPKSALVQVQIAGAEMALSRLPEALTAIRRALALEPDDSVAQLTAVRLLTDKGAWAEALAIAHGAQRRHPQAALGYRLEGDILMTQEHAAEALKLYEQAFRLEPTGPAMVALHRTLQAMGRQQQATTRMQQWLRDHPGDLPARLYLASALMHAGEYAPAVVQYQAIVEADPQHVIALNDLAWTLQQMKDSRALAYAERAYKLANGNATVNDTLGWVLLEQGQAARALPLLKQASSALPAASEVRYHYANALLRTGDKPGARRQFELLLADKNFARQSEVRALVPQL